MLKNFDILNLHPTQGSSINYSSEAVQFWSWEVEKGEMKQDINKFARIYQI